MAQKEEELLNDLQKYGIQTEEQKQLLAQRKFSIQRDEHSRNLSIDNADSKKALLDVQLYKT